MIIQIEAVVRINTIIMVDLNVFLVFILIPHIIFGCASVYVITVYSISYIISKEYFLV